jgi:radical SAM-linked protein
MIYIGHLDVMRYFQKVIRRAGIPIKFSEGYSPHMIMSFASPLGLGITSEGEYFDIELTESIDSQEAIDRMNETSVEGIEVISFKQISSEKKNSGMTILAGASYLVTFGEQDNEILLGSLDRKIEESSFMKQSTIEILKETKRSEKIVDIKPLIYDIQFKYNNSIQMLLAAGSKENLKPNLVVQALAEYLELDFSKLTFNCHRIEMFADVGNDKERSLVSLESLGEDIV